MRTTLLIAVCLVLSVTRAASSASNAASTAMQSDAVHSFPQPSDDSGDPWHAPSPLEDLKTFPGVPYAEYDVRSGVLHSRSHDWKSLIAHKFDFKTHALSPVTFPSLPAEYAAYIISSHAISTYEEHGQLKVIFGAVLSLGSKYALTFHELGSEHWTKPVEVSQSFIYGTAMKGFYVEFKIPGGQGASDFWSFAYIDLSDLSHPVTVYAPHGAISMAAYSKGNYLVLINGKFLRILRYHPQRKMWERYSYRLNFGYRGSASLFYDEEKNQLIVMLERYRLPDAQYDPSKWCYLVVNLGWPHETLPSPQSIAEQRALVEDAPEKVHFLRLYTAEREGPGYTSMAYDPSSGMFILLQGGYDGTLHLYGPRAEDDAMFFKAAVPELETSEYAYTRFDPARRLLIQVRDNSDDTYDVHLFHLDSFRRAYVRASFLKLVRDAGAPLSVGTKRLARVTEAVGVPIHLIWRILIKKLLIPVRFERIDGFLNPVTPDVFTKDEVASGQVKDAKLERIVTSTMLDMLFGRDHPFTRWYWRRIMEKMEHDLANRAPN